MMRTGSFPGLKRPVHGVDHPPSSSAEVKERVELYLYSPVCAFMASSRVSFTSTFYRVEVGKVVFQGLRSVPSVSFH